MAMRERKSLKSATAAAAAAGGGTSQAPATVFDFLNSALGTPGQGGKGRGGADGGKDKGGKGKRGASNDRVACNAEVMAVEGQVRCRLGVRRARAHVFRRVP